MKTLIKIMYEDEQAKGANSFALHVLILRCVLEELRWEESEWDALARLVECAPKKGVPKLLAACEDAREAKGFRHVLRCSMMTASAK